MKVAKIVLIRDLRRGNTELVYTADPNAETHKMVEAWQRSNWRYQTTGRLPSVAFRIANSTDIAKAMCEEV